MPSLNITFSTIVIFQKEAQNIGKEYVTFENEKIYIYMSISPMNEEGG